MTDPEENRLDPDETMIAMESSGLFDKEKSENDHGYFSLHMWDAARYNPCCYHKSCWESVGKPFGYRGPSIYAGDQGFGTAALFFNDHEREEDGYAPELMPQKPEEAIGVWAANAINHFIYTAVSYIAATCQAEQTREMWRTIARLENTMNEARRLIAEGDSGG